MRLLLLEDDLDLAAQLCAGLRRAGFAVDHVATIADADLAVTVTDYDCLVLDRTVPDGDALTMVRVLRDRGDEVAVVVLTARDTVEDRVDGFHVGADDYLVKPFAFAELVSRIRALGRRAADPTPPVLRAGDLELDLARHRAHRDGALLTLTAKEFQVLEVLLSASGRVVGRSELLERCWDEMSAPGSNVVDVLVGQLRRRLGPPDPIETIRGVGYRVPV